MQPHYYWQLQHQLMVSGAAKADFYVFEGEEGIVVEVVRIPMISSSYGKGGTGSGSSSGPTRLRH